MKSKIPVRVSIVVLVISLLSTGYSGHGYYKNVYLVKRGMPEDAPVIGMSVRFPEIAHMWTIGLWISALLAAVFAVTTTLLYMRSNRRN